MMQLNDYASLITFGLSVMGGLLTLGWLAAWWFSKKFGEVHDNIEDKTDNLEKNIISKLEYHERHDDERFSEIRTAVWEIKVRNAASDSRK